MRTDYQKLGRGEAGVFLVQVLEGAWSVDTLIADFNLQNCEMIKFCHFKPPCLWYLVTAALGNEHTLLLDLPNKKARVGA